MVTDHAEKMHLMAEKQIHKKRAKAFFSFLKDPTPDVFIVAFDCEKNQALPKVPDSAAYYLRQIYLYNFTTVVGHSKSPLTPENVMCFTWTENLYRKDSNTIASCVYHQLTNADLTAYKTVRLIADGCPGQNKNTVMIAMLMYWLTHKAPTHITDVSVVFPVTGHSFLPPDRVFGQIERSLKKQDTILSPEELLKVISKYGTVVGLEESVTIYDFKSAGNDVVKKASAWPFQISQMKRIMVHKTENGRVLVRGEPYYFHDVANFQSTIRKNKSFSDFHPVEIQAGNAISLEKIKDVKTLLEKHFGTNWREIESLRFFKNLFHTGVQDHTDEIEDDPECTFSADPPELIV